MLSKKVLKDIQSLTLKKHRDETGLFLAEGPKVVEEFMRVIPGQIEQVYALEDGASVTVPIPTLQGETGAIFQVRRDGGQIHVAAHGADKSWRVLLVGVQAASCGDGGTAEPSGQGVLVTPSAGAAALVIAVER